MKTVTIKAIELIRLDHDNARQPRDMEAWNVKHIRIGFRDMAIAHIKAILEEAGFDPAEDIYMTRELTTLDYTII